MRLRRPCEHDRYDEHDWRRSLGFDDFATESCPGGEFLPEDAAVLIRKHAEHGYPYIEEAEPREWGDDDFGGWYLRVAPPSLTYLGDQVGEPG